MSALYKDAIAHIISFDPHWSFAYISREWNVAWCRHAQLSGIDMHHDLSVFATNRARHAMLRFHTNCDTSLREHQLRHAENRHIVGFLLSCGINPYLEARCDSCHQELSHMIIRDCALLAGTYDGSMLYHLLVAPLEIRDEFDVSRNDSCQQLVARYTLCTVCIQRETPCDLVITELWDAPP